MRDVCDTPEGHTIRTVRVLNFGGGGGPLAGHRTKFMPGKIRVVVLLNKDLYFFIFIMFCVTTEN
jgi:hypothetical protein